MENKDIIIANKIASKVADLSGRVYFVGGYVRDLLRGVENKDIDIEVHGITPGQLENILDSVGNRTELGKSFGIYGLKGYNIDVAMPRTEKKSGRSHRDFEVSVDPFIGTENAAKRRDFTINSLMQDVLTGEIIDHFGGADDIKKKVIRHTNAENFSEDPLRVLRAAQFAARFQFEVCNETCNLCKTIDLSEITRERVNEELKKALLKSEKPSLFFEFLKTTNKLDDWFGELKNLIGLEQNPKYHPEGDVWIHTMMTIDSCVKFRDDADNPYGFMLLALCHDMGKFVCTTVDDGIIHSYKHEIEGLYLADTFIRRLTSEKNLLKYILNMIENHTKPYAFAVNKSSVKACNKMFDSVVSASDIINFALCDNCVKENTAEFDECKIFLNKRLDMFNEYMSRPYITGSDLISAGIKPDKNFKDILAYAHKLRLAGVKKEIALKEVLAYCRKYRQTT